MLLLSAFALASLSPDLETGDEWLKRCESHTPSICASGVRGFYSGLKLQGDPSVCADVRLDKKEDFKPMAEAVIEYLRQHPEVRAELAGKALLTALRATHPCPRG